MIRHISHLKDKLQQAKVAAGLLHGEVYTGPWNVQIDLTNRCNNDCIACWCNSPLLGDKTMNPAIKNETLNFETTIKLIDELDDMGVRAIYFTGGGEPFMHPKILDIMRHIKAKDIHLDMSTNFTLVSEDTAEQLVDIGIDHMTLSLWAGTPETYAKQHPNKDTHAFLKMEAMIDHIVETKSKRNVDTPALGMYNVMNTYNYHEAEEMLEFAFKHKMDDIVFTPVDTIPGRTEILRITADQRAELSGKIKEISRNIGAFEKKYHHEIHFKDYDCILRRLESPHANDTNYDTDILNALPTCYAGWSFARVLATGDVNSCLKSFKIPVGNIYKNSFKDIWFGEKQTVFRKHTIQYDKDDPYFRNMGNDLSTDDQGCIKCCDNLGINMSIYEKMTQLRSWEKQLLNLLHFFW